MIRKTLMAMTMMIMLSGCNSYHLFGKQADEHSVSSISKALKRDVPADFFPTNIHLVSLWDSLTQGIGDSGYRGGYIPYLIS